MKDRVAGGRFDAVPAESRSLLYRLRRLFLAFHLFPFYKQMRAAAALQLRHVSYSNILYYFELQSLQELVLITE
jgi:hypothetical protein